MNVPRSQMRFNVPQFNPAFWHQIPVVVPQVQQPTVGEVIGKLLVLGIGCAVVYAGIEAVFGEEKPVRRCGDCGGTNHTARNCPVTSPRTRLSIKKTGQCRCCGGKFRYTEAHHYAGRGVDRGKEMCGPCHFHCGHAGDWFKTPVNPRYCHLAS